MSVFAGPNGITDGLVLHLDASNPRSYPGTGTTWFDVSGNRNHGTLTNMSVPACHVRTYGGRAMEFDGSNDHIQINNSNTLKTDSITVSAWVRRVSDTGNYESIISAWKDDGVNERAYNLVVGPGDKFEFAISTDGGGAGAELVIGTTSASLNRWFHVCGTYDKANVRLYVNSNLEATANRSGSVYQNYSYNPRIGAKSVTSLTELWPGQMDDIRIYNRALSTQEIQYNFQATRGRFNI